MVKAGRLLLVGGGRSLSCFSPVGVRAGAEGRRARVDILVTWQLLSGTLTVHNSVVQ